MQKIRTFLWFQTNFEDAARFYTSLFKNSKMGDLMRGPDGKVMGGTFMLDGQEFMGLNGGPQFAFTEAISLFVDCTDQREVDELWAKLTADGGEESQCGWLKDRFGLSWQIIPSALPELLGDKDPGRAKRALDAMLTMRKIDVAALRRAADGA